jgi:hypothetical protein
LWDRILVALADQTRVNFGRGVLMN